MLGFIIAPVVLLVVASLWMCRRRFRRKLAIENVRTIVIY